ncbi:MAG: hypothetical protein ABIB43_06055 [archaeon]
MKTKNWNQSEHFIPAKESKHITFKEVIMRIPEGVDEAIRLSWDEQLLSKQKELASQNIIQEIKPYHLDKSNNPLNALYEKNQPKMWPGPVITLKYANESPVYSSAYYETNLELEVAQTFYPFIAGLKDKKISKLYEEQGIEKPNPALGICTFVITTDDQLVLTVRGARTNVYPGRLYGQGGNPKFTNTNIVNHQLDEMLDEIVLAPGHVDKNSFRFYGIAEDTEELIGKPDIVGTVSAFVDSEYVMKGVSARPMKNRPNDAIGIVFVPATEGELFDYLVKRSNVVQFCPPAHAGLLMYGDSKFGSTWSSKALKNINS